MFSTLSNDSWANFFAFNFDFLLVTSCHCSFSLSSNKHHACNSSSSSCTSSLMSPLSSSTAFRLLFQLPLTQFAAMCPVFTTAPADSGVTFATFLLPFSSILASSLGPLSLCQHRFASVSPSPLLKYFCTLQLGPFPPFHPPSGSCSLVHCLHCKFRCYLSALLRMFPRHRFLRPCRSPIGVLVSIFFTFVAERVVTLSMMMFSSAMSNFFEMAMWCHGIESSANSRASTFSLPESFLRLGFSQTFLCTCSSR